MFIFLFLSSLNFLPLLFSSISSFSLYPFLGSIRAISLLLSYEINISIIFIYYFFFSHSFNFFDILFSQISASFFFPPFFILLFISLLAESSRTPFDLIEGESEIVGGYLTEYSGLFFSLLYLSEYLSFFLHSALLSLFFSLPFLFILFLFFLSRSFFPRYQFSNILFFNLSSLLPLNFSFLSLLFWL